MKILRAYPKTIQQTIDSLVQLPKELEYVVLLNIYEIVKNLPEDTIKQENGVIFKEVIPIFYINRFQLSDNRLKTLARKLHTHMSDLIP